MEPGFYVVRMPKRGTGSRLIVESVPFQSRDASEHWCNFVQSQHPEDDVFVIERKTF